MNRQELIDKMAADAGLTKKQAGMALNSFIDAVSLTLEKGDKITLVGFGTFKVNHRDARKGINPQTKKTIDIPARSIPVFKAGKKLKESVK
jgi:DNA-binding protein HU-beta